MTFVLDIYLADYLKCQCVTIVHTHVTFLLMNIFIAYVTYGLCEPNPLLMREQCCSIGWW